MTPPRRKRSVQLNFRVSEEELAAIEGKMEQLGILNREAYLRKMALDGYAVRLDLPELKELLSLLRRHSSNLNQLVRRVNTTGRVYEADLEDIIKRQSELWEEHYRAGLRGGPGGYYQETERTLGGHWPDTDPVGRNLIRLICCHEVTDVS